MEMKLAIVHDYLTQVGGAERIVLNMCEAFPDAPVFTSVYHPETTFKAFKDKDVRVTYLQKPYRIFNNHRLLMPFYPKAFESINLDGFNVILSSSSAFAKGIKKPRGAAHICYCYNPTRFIWMREAYLAEERLAFAKKAYLELFYNSLKKWDMETIGDIDYLVSISTTVKERIRRCYGRDSRLIYPPVDCDKFSISDKNEGYYLLVSRLMAHKRVDLAIKAFNSLGFKLKIAGMGPQYPVLKKMSSRNIEFTGVVVGDELKKLYNRCIAVIFPQEEDFGLVPLEANASGKPVVAFAKGGALETLIPYDESSGNGTAVFFYNQTAEDLAEAVNRLARIKFNPARLRENALKFDKPVFISKIRAVTEEARGGL